MFQLKGSVCVCKITVVSKRVRAALLHQWLVFQAYICGEINAECWWERYVASDSSPSYTQINTHTHMHTHTHTHRHACTHSGWIQHWFEEDTLAMITECLTCYFKCICSFAHTHTHTHTRTDSQNHGKNGCKQTNTNNSVLLFPPNVFQTHDACMERWARLIIYTRWLPGQSQIGCHRAE